MEFRKTVVITLYAKQKKRHRCTEQTFGLWKKARVGCFERTACILSIVKHHQPRWDAGDKCSGLVHWEDPEESGGEGGGRGDRDGEYMELHG